MDLAKKVKEGLWLSGAEARVKGYSAAQRARVAELAYAARNRLGAALELREDSSIASALTLLREASALSICALLVARGELDTDGVLDAPAAWARLDALELPGAPASLAVARSALTAADALAIDRMAPAEARATRASVESAITWIGRLYEARSVRQIRVQRVVRIGGLAAGLVVLLLATAATAVSPKDIALHKPVLASGRYNPSPEPSHVVDGVKDGHFGAHTSMSDYPWIRIDLEAEYRVTKVVVSNRGDGYFDEILPVALQFSNDGRHWKEIAVRSEHYTEKEPWVQPVNGEVTRYIRLQSKKKHAYLWASEIEAYGSKK